MAVTPDPRQIRLDQRLDVDLLIVPLTLTHLHAALQKHAQVHHLFLAGTLLRETEEVRNQLPGPLGLLHNLANRRVLSSAQAVIRPQLLRTFTNTPTAIASPR